MLEKKIQPATRRNGEEQRMPTTTQAGPWYGNAEEDSPQESLPGHPDLPKVADARYLRRDMKNGG